MKDEELKHLQQDDGGSLEGLAKGIEEYSKQAEEVKAEADTKQSHIIESLVFIVAKMAERINQQEREIARINYKVAALMHHE